MGTSEVWPGGVAARAIEKADAKAWAELLAVVELADHAGENYDADDLIEELGSEAQRGHGHDRPLVGRVDGRLRQGVRT